MPLHLPHCYRASVIADTRTTNESHVHRITLFSSWKSIDRSTATRIHAASRHEQDVEDGRSPTAGVGAGHF